MERNISHCKSAMKGKKRGRPLAYLYCCDDVGLSDFVRLAMLLCVSMVRTYYMRDCFERARDGRVTYCPS